MCHHSLQQTLQDMYLNINFLKIWYDQSSQKLMTTIVKCEDLPKKDRLSQSDGYVKVFLLPGKHKLKTKVVNAKKSTWLIITLLTVTLQRSMFRGPHERKQLGEGDDGISFYHSAIP